MSSQGFTRQETIILSGCTSSKLAYLDRTKLICPQKLGNPKKPVCLYSWTQLVQTTIINSAKGVYALRVLKAFLSKSSKFIESESLHNEWLVLNRDKVVLYSDSESLLRDIRHGHKPATLMFLPPISEAIQTIWNRAWSSHSATVDYELFQQRAVTQPKVSPTAHKRP